MRKRTLTAGVCSLALIGAGIAVTGQADAAAPAPTAAQLALARQTLAPNDGWGAATTGTTGGSAAADAAVQVVSTRAELVKALGGDNATNATNATPKIVFIKGVIDANEDDTGTPIECDTYAEGTGYSFDAYVKAYDPAVWGMTTRPAGALEDARVAAKNNQSKQVIINVGSNTTIIGLGATARFIGGTLRVLKADNVIIRNLKFQNAQDCFPQWNPTDNSPGEAPGNWNSEYDNVLLNGGTHVWLDHNTFTDRPNPDSEQELVFGRPLQVHDGATDIINASDYVTVSWNDYVDHDKVNLIGGSNTSTIDPGKLRVTVHHNRYTDTLQRMPRVRFGQVDVYNNLFLVPAKSPDRSPYLYGLGVGKESAIVAENNYWRLGTGYTPAGIVYNWGGTKVTTKGNWVKVGDRKAGPFDLVAEFNAANPTLVLGTDAGWTPTLRGTLDTALAVQKVVPPRVGSGRIG